ALRYTAPKPIKSIAGAAGLVVLRLEDGTLIRFDRATSDVVAIQLPKVTSIAIAPDGVIWLARNRVLYRWSDVVAIYGVMDVPIATFSVGAGLPVIKLTDLTRWRARPGGGFGRIEVGNPLDVINDEIVVGKSGSTLDVVRVRTGEQFSYSLPSTVTNITVGEDPHVLFVSLTGDYLLEFADPVPDDPDAAWSWIEHATNARVDPATDETLWD
ncbi:MAG TPA: hypothetical protein VG963_05570, partial [Polyangiaceae bacterium]|nr:hypothetical protein [Polyangiaceae bacterium]